MIPHYTDCRHHLLLPLEHSPLFARIICILHPSCLGIYDIAPCRHGADDTALADEMSAYESCAVALVFPCVSNMLDLALPKYRRKEERVESMLGFQAYVCGTG